MQSISMSASRTRSVTPTQVLSVFQTIANGGVRLPASLVESCTQADGTVDYYTLVFAAKLDIYESAEYLLLDGKLYTVKITVL